MSRLDARVERSIKEAAHILLARQGRLRRRQELEEAACRSDKWVTSTLNRLIGATVVDSRTLRFTRECGFALGIALGTESLRAGLVDANGQLHHPYEVRLAHQLDLSKQRLLAHVGRAAAQVLGRALADPALRMRAGRLAVLGVTVAWPVPLDRDFRPKTAWLGDRAWGDEPVPVPVGRLLGGPFADARLSHAINDANAAVMALAYDEAVARIGEPAGERSRILMALRLSGGIGAGTMELRPHHPKRLSFLDSSLIVGTSGYAGEIGHLPASHSVVAAVQRFSGRGDVPDPHDRLARLRLDRVCSCGAKGGAAELDDMGAAAHLEAVAGAWALADRLHDSGYDLDEQAAVGDQIGRLLERIDPEIERALWECGALIGRAMAAPILMLDPAKIMLTGLLAREPVATGFNDIRARSKRAPTNTVKAEIRRGDGYLEVRGAALGTVRQRCWRQIDFDPLGLPSSTRPWTETHQKALIARVSEFAGG